MILPDFKNLLLASSLSADIQERLLRAIEKLNTQEQVFLLQLFEKYPEKIPAFWDMSKKKFEYMKNAVGNLNDIVEEEQKLFSLDN